MDDAGKLVMAQAVLEFEEQEQDLEKAQEALAAVLKTRKELAHEIFSMRTGVRIGTILKVTESRGKVREALVVHFDAPYTHARLHDVQEWSPNVWVRYRKKDGAWGVESHRLWTYDTKNEIIGEDMEVVK